MKNVYVANKHSFAELTLPLLWCSLKTYFEENSSKHTEYQWADPWIADYRSKEEILNECQKAPPDIFGFSVYVWNESFFDEVAEEVKNQYPNCLIVYGGPQPHIKYNENFFKEKPWVDIVVPSDAYGEIVFKEILDYFPITDYEKIPYIYYADKDKNRCFSKLGIEKKSFKWPNNIYKAQEKYLLPYAGQFMYGSIETSRGCPYKCIYCDWGGGTYTKVVKKPFDIVLDEIEWIGANKVKLFSTLDANFGIYEIDVAITEHIVDVAKKYGYPKTVVTENAKNHLARTTKIKELLAEQGLLDHHKISVQAIDEEIKNNVERIDPPIEKQIASVNYLRSKFPELPVKVEIIAGLPGDNYQKTLNQIDILVNNNLSAARPNTWILLPETPAFSPEMREQFKIQTVPKMMSTESWLVKEEFEIHPAIFNSHTWNNPTVESVVETYSYTKDEWVDMYLVNGLAFANDYTGVNAMLCRYIKDTHHMEPSFVQDFIYKNYVKPKLSNEDVLEKLFALGYQTIHQWVHDVTFTQHGIDYHPDFPILLPPRTYFAFVALTNAQLFYSKLCNDLAKRLNDPIISDLGIYLRNGVLDSEYNPNLGREFDTEYDWLTYFKIKQLNRGSYTYQINDQTIFVNQTYQDITWHQHQATPLKQYEQYFYQAISLADSKFSRTIKLIE